MRPLLLRSATTCVDSMDSISCMQDPLQQAAGATGLWETVVPLVPSLLLLLLMLLCIASQGYIVAVSQQHLSGHQVVLLGLAACKHRSSIWHSSPKSSDFNSMQTCHMLG